MADSYGVQKFIDQFQQSINPQKHYGHFLILQNMIADIEFTSVKEQWIGQKFVD